MWSPVVSLLPLLLALQTAVAPVAAGSIHGIDGVWLNHNNEGNVGLLTPTHNAPYNFNVNIGQYQGTCQAYNVKAMSGEHKIGWDYDKKKFTIGMCRCNDGSRLTCHTGSEPNQQIFDCKDISPKDDC